MDFKSGNDTAMALDLDTHDTVDEPTTKKKAVAMDKPDNGSEQLVQEAAGEALAGAVAAVAAVAIVEFVVCAVFVVMVVSRVAHYERVLCMLQFWCTPHVLCRVCGVRIAFCGCCVVVLLC